MTQDQFRRLALALPESVEAEHMGHPDFRVRGGGIFASLFDRTGVRWGMVKLPPAEQARLVASHPEVFQPAAGAWGRQGCTLVQLAAADRAAVRRAVVTAWRHVAPPRMAEALGPPDPAPVAQGKPSTPRRPPRRPAAAPALTFLALLRGINVGGRNLLPMADLVRMFEASGCAAVRTYIQSGNVLFTAAPALAQRLPAQIARRVSDAFGFQPAIILRSVADLARAAAANPFAGDRPDPARLHIGFLDRRPAPARVRALDPSAFPGDRIEVRGSEVYLLYRKGPSQSRLTYAWLDRALGVTSTFRNWRTVQRLLDMAQA